MTFVIGCALDVARSSRMRRPRHASLRRDMNGRRRLQLLVLVSLVVWEAWEAARPFPHPWGDLAGGVYSDHFSHMNCARLLPRAGLGLWRQPIDRPPPPLTVAAEAGLPASARSGG